MIEWVVVVNIINVSDDKDLPAQVFMDGLWSQHPVSWKYSQPQSTLLCDLAIWMPSYNLWELHTLCHVHV